MILFRINVLDRFSREQQVARSLYSLPPNTFSSFPPYCLHFVLVSITLAPVRLTGRRRRQRTFTSRAAFGIAFAESLRATGRNTATLSGPARALREVDLSSIFLSVEARLDRFAEIPADRKRRFRSTHSHDRSVPRSMPRGTFPSYGRSHWVQDDPATFHHFFTAIVLAFHKKKKK